MAWGSLGVRLRRAAGRVVQGNREMDHGLGGSGHTAEMSGGWGSTEQWRMDHGLGESRDRAETSGGQGAGQGGTVCLQPGIAACSRLTSKPTSLLLKSAAPTAS